MKFSEILKAGFTITIQPDGVNNKGFIPTTFFYFDNMFWSMSNFFVNGYAPRPSWTDEKLNRHIAEMVKARFQIVITANEAHEKVYCLMKLLHHEERSAEA